MSIIDLSTFNLIHKMILLFVLSTFGLMWMLKLSFKLNWFDIPVARSSHNGNIPRTAGIILTFFSVALLIVWGPNEFIHPLIILSYIFFFFIGVYDDIKNLKASTKFWAQLFICATITLALPEFRINNFYGILGLYSISSIYSIIFSIFVYIVVINAYNLIDGIDGLALTFSIFAIFMLSIGYNDISQPMTNYGMLLISILLPFYFFNFSKKYKMFLGDTGSIFLGMTIVLMVGYFLNSNHPVVVPFRMNRAVFALVALCYPLLDTLRVFILRVTKGLSPFTADRNHIHHKLLNIGFSHYSTTISLLVFNLLILFVNCYSLQNIDANAVVIIDFILIGVFFVGGVWFARIKVLKRH